MGKHGASTAPEQPVVPEAHIPTVKRGLEMADAVVREMYDMNPRRGFNPQAIVRWRETLHDAVVMMKEARRLAKEKKASS